MQNSRVSQVGKSTIWHRLNKPHPMQNNINTFYYRDCSRLMHNLLTLYYFMHKGKKYAVLRCCIYKSSSIAFSNSSNFALQLCYNVSLRTKWIYVTKDNYSMNEKGPGICMFISQRCTKLSEIFFFFRCQSLEVRFSAEIHFIIFGSVQNIQFL